MERTPKNHGSSVPKTPFGWIVTVPVGSRNLTRAGRTALKGLVLGLVVVESLPGFGNGLSCSHSSLILHDCVYLRMRPGRLIAGYSDADVLDLSLTLDGSNEEDGKCT